MDYKIKHLISDEGNFYKANLSASSNLSDGRFSTKELCDLYEKNGYSILALTDGEAKCQKEFSKDNFLLLSAFKFGSSMEKAEGVPRKSAYFTAISLSENPKEVTPFDAYYGSERVNEFLSEYKEKDYFLTYTAPVKSLENLPDRLRYDPLDAIEIMNYSSLMEGYDEYCATIYDDLLRHGKRLYALGSDANRNKMPLLSELSDSFGVFTMIKSKGLDYGSVADALRRGDFYCSEAPLINDIRIKGNTVHLKCTPCDKITMFMGRRGAKTFYASSSEELTSATFTVDPRDVYVRFIVTDSEGRRAYTRAYYTDEIL